MMQQAKAAKAGGASAAAPPMIARRRVVQRMEAVLDDDAQVKIKQGLIYGTWTRASNVADLHVAPKGDGGGLKAATMLAVASQCYDLMTHAHRMGAPEGRFELRPAGAMVVKSVVDILGEALPSIFSPSYIQGLYYKHSRKSAEAERMKHEGAAYKKKVRSMAHLESDVWPEHFALLNAIREKDGLQIVPEFTGRNIKLGKEDFVKKPDGDYLLVKGEVVRKDMSDDDVFEKYKRSVEGGHNEGPDAPVSLAVHLSARHLPAVIKVLEKAVQSGL
ncbi:MAG: hypothetical protein WDN69_07670 [Aliidongia sp.]